MAIRPCFVINDQFGKFFEEIDISFEYFSGFSIIQKKKSIQSLHHAIFEKFPNLKVLEVSSKSDSYLGNKLSAFNLSYHFKNGNTLPLENVFQGAKVFEKGGPFDFSKFTPSESKKFIKNHQLEFGHLTKFYLEGENWPLKPASMFYDYIYIKSLLFEPNLCNQLRYYSIFTDIEFNPRKSINCQARSVAIAVSLIKQNLLEQYINNKRLFQSLYLNKESGQMDLFN